MSGTKELLKNLFQKSGNLFLGHWLNFLGFFAVFFIPLALLYNYYWDNLALTDSLIEKYSLQTVRMVDNIFYVFFLLFFLLYLNAVMLKIHAADQGKRLGVVKAYGKALVTFPQYLWMKCLCVFKVLCWSLLLVVPGILYGIFYSFAGVAFLTDGKKAENALNLSRNILRPNLRKYCLSVACLAVCVSVICVLFIMCFDTIIYMLSIRGNFLIVRLFNYSEVIFTALAGIYFLTQYYYLYRELKEEAGLN